MKSEEPNSYKSVTSPTLVKKVICTRADCVRKGWTLVKKRVAIGNEQRQRDFARTPYE